MASLQISLEQLHKHGITPTQMLAYLEELDAIGFKINMQAKHPEEMNLLGQMSTLRRTKQRLVERRQFLSLIVLSTLCGLGSIMWGLNLR